LSELVTPSSDFSNLATGVSGLEIGSDQNKLDIDTGTYIFGEPTHMEFTQDEYESIIDGSGYDWSTSAGSTFNSISSIGGAGMIIVNEAQTALNDQYEGYYIGLTDNMFVNPGLDYRGVRNILTVTDPADFTTDYTAIPQRSLEFNLSSQFDLGSDSISDKLENIADYDISGRDSDDLLGVATFKLRKSLFATEGFKLDYVMEDRILGSIDYAASKISPKGGPAVNFFLGNSDTQSRNVEIFINDNIANRLGGNNMRTDGTPSRRARVFTSQLVDSNVPSRSGVSTSFLESLASGSDINYADNLYAFGAYNGQRIDDKVIGETPTKVNRALRGVRNLDVYDIDVVVEAGVGTVYAASLGAGTAYYDEYNFNNTLAAQVNELRTSNLEIENNAQAIRSNYMSVFQELESFCAPVRGGRGDCMLVADPLRHIYVTGKNLKIDSLKNSIFQTDIYWATRHQFELANTSYAATYANWAQVYDRFTGQNVWVPFSGFAAAVMANTSANRFPWIAPAGFNNGLIQTALDIASVPNQKERDELYKASLNPVTFFPAQGQVIFGQKTMQRKPSAFDRINVRRLFQALERPTRKAAQYFVFEPNTVFTRTRLINTISPIFSYAQQNEGLYEYLIVCDERNNTPQVIDNNELVVDIYIKPVRAAEFILINFVATRTDANFQEIIGA
jgi:hypothetical protein